MDAEKAPLQHREFSGDTSETGVRHFGMHPMIFLDRSLNPAGSQTLQHDKHLTWWLIHTATNIQECGSH